VRKYNRKKAKHTSKHILNAIATHQNTAARNPNCNIAPEESWFVIPLLKYVASGYLEKYIGSC